MSDRAPEIQRDQANLEASLDRIQRVGLVAGLLGLVAALVGLFLSGPAVFFQAYLVAYLFCLGIALGSLAIVLLHYLAAGSWGVVIRRPLEAAARTLPVLALLFIPLLFGLRYLYPWAQPELVAADPILQHRSTYLNLPFFAIRAVLYFAIWTFLAYRLRNWADRPEAWGDTPERRRMQGWAALGLIVYVLTTTFAVTDWMMSIEPHWFSTIYGLLIIAGQVLAGFVLALIILPLLVRDRTLADFITPAHYRDLGALLLSMVIFWAYLAFSQFIIIWAGNLPQEVTWYQQRGAGGWLWLGLLVIAVQFVLPFFMLLPLRTKRNLLLLAGLGVAILVMRQLDYFWQVLPTFYPTGPGLSWVHFAAPLALFGLWLAAFIWFLKRTPLLLLPLPKRHASVEHSEESGRLVA